MPLQPAVCASVGRRRESVPGAQAQPVAQRRDAREQRRHVGQRPGTGREHARPAAAARRERVEVRRGRADVAVAAQPVGAQAVHHDQQHVAAAARTDRDARDALRRAHRQLAHADHQVLRALQLQVEVQAQAGPGGRVELRERLVHQRARRQAHRERADQPVLDAQEHAAVLRRTVGPRFHHVQQRLEPARRRDALAQRVDALALLQHEADRAVQPGARALARRRHRPALAVGAPEQFVRLRPAGDLRLGLVHAAAPGDEHHVRDHDRARDALPAEHRELEREFLAGLHRQRHAPRLPGALPDAVRLHRSTLTERRHHPQRQLRLAADGARPEAQHGPRARHGHAEAQRAPRLHAPAQARRLPEDHALGRPSGRVGQERQAPVGAEVRRLLVLPPEGEGEHAHGHGGQAQRGQHGTAARPGHGATAPSPALFAGGRGLPSARINATSLAMRYSASS
jgi:hypothetical protein